MAQRLHQVDASFLAGEADPAIVARLDDVVRANAASKIRNMYVRSAGGVRSRPGMRVSHEIEGRQLRVTRGVVMALQPGDPGTRMLAATTLSPESPAVVTGWDARDAVVLEVDFGNDDEGNAIVLPAGTELVVRMGIAASAPAGWTNRLWWWEKVGASPPAGVRQTSLYSSGGGLAATRFPGADEIYLNQPGRLQTFRHVLVAPATGFRIWKRRWRNGEPSPDTAFPETYSIEIGGWSAEAARALGSADVTRDKPAVRALDVSWWPDSPALMVLHGTQSDVFLKRGGSLQLNPFGYDTRRSTGFSREQVLSMQVSRTPNGAILSSPVFGGYRRFGWRPFLFRLATDDNQFALRMDEMGDFLEPAADSGWDPTNPPNTMAAYQERLIVAGTRRRPNGVWFSRTGTLNEFRAPPISLQRQPLATDAFMVQEMGTPMNEIVAIHGGLLLVFFGTESISFLDRPAVSATDFGFKQMAERGIKRGVPPIEIGTGKLAFVDASGKSIWQMTYANERQGYVLTELSQVAPHLLREPEDLIFYPGLPEGGTAALAVNGDSTLACCSIQPEGEWSAWSLWTTDELLDVETFDGALWAVTRRGARGAPQPDGSPSPFVDPALYLEVFDDECELDFAYISKDGTHPYADSYETWAAVCRMKDGSRHRVGMRVPEEEATDEELEAIEEEKPTSSNVRIGLRHAVDSFERLGIGNVDDIEDFEVGRPFMWRVQTMPFVKRSGQGSVFRGLTKTQECFVQWEQRHRTAGREEDQVPVPMLINGAELPPTPRLFAVPEGDVLAQGDVLYSGSSRFVNLVGWREQNQLDVCGQGALTIPSFQRTVVS